MHIQFRVCIVNTFASAQDNILRTQGSASYFVTEAFSPFNEFHIFPSYFYQHHIPKVSMSKNKDLFTFQLQTLEPFLVVLVVLVKFDIQFQMLHFIHCLRCAIKSHPF